MFETMGVAGYKNFGQPLLVSLFLSCSMYHWLQYRKAVKEVCTISYFIGYATMLVGMGVVKTDAETW